MRVWVGNYSFPAESTKENYSPQTLQIQTCRPVLSRAVTSESAAAWALVNFYIFVIQIPLPSRIYVFILGCNVTFWLKGYIKIILHYRVFECIKKTNQLCVLSRIFVMDGFFVENFRFTECIMINKLKYHTWIFPVFQCICFSIYVIHWR